MRTSDRPHAFTLLEVMLATVITAIALTALLATFRTAVRAWDTGHGLSEILQTARITQEVMLRDLNNLLYLNESEYNAAFRQQLQMLGQRVVDPNDPFGMERLDPRRPRPRSADPASMPELDAGSIAMPIDLSFRADDGGLLDQLSFARSVQVQRPGDPLTWGIRRVEYHVEDGRLYRRETDPFEFRPGEAAADYYYRSGWSSDARLAEVLRLFQRPPTAGERAFLPGPLQYGVAEPLCEGVRMFDVSFGYFRDGQWNEVAAWDSGARRWRNPPDPEEQAILDAVREARLRGDTRLIGGIGADVVAAALARAARSQPDDLPGYIAVQLGVQDPRGRGRLYSFTFYYSVPQAQETHTLPAEASLRGTTPRSIPSSGGGRAPARRR